MADQESLSSAARLAQMADLGTARFNALPLEDRSGGQSYRPSRNRGQLHGVQNAAAVQILSDGWNRATVDGSLNDEDAAAVSGLDTLGGARVYDHTTNRQRGGGTMNTRRMPHINNHDSGQGNVGMIDGTRGPRSRLGPVMDSHSTVASDAISREANGTSGHFGMTLDPRQGLPDGGRGHVGNGNGNNRTAASTRPVNFSGGSQNALVAGADGVANTAAPTHRSGKEIRSKTPCDDADDDFSTEATPSMALITTLGNPGSNPQAFFELEHPESGKSVILNLKDMEPMSKTGTSQLLLSFSPDRTKKNRKTFMLNFFNGKARAEFCASIDRYHDFVTMAVQTVGHLNRPHASTAAVAANGSAKDGHGTSTPKPQPLVVNHESVPEVNGYVTNLAGPVAPSPTTQDTDSSNLIGVRHEIPVQTAAAKTTGATTSTRREPAKTSMIGSIHGNSGMTCTVGNTGPTIDSVSTATEQVVEAPDNYIDQAVKEMMGIWKVLDVKMFVSSAEDYHFQGLRYILFKSASEKQGRNPAEKEILFNLFMETTARGYTGPYRATPFGATSGSTTQNEGAHVNGTKANGSATTAVQNGTSGPADRFNCRDTKTERVKYTPSEIMGLKDNATNRPSALNGAMFLPSQRKNDGKKVQERHSQPTQHQQQNVPAWPSSSSRDAALTPWPSTAFNEQIAADEKLARQLQAQDYGHEVKTDIPKFSPKAGSKGASANDGSVGFGTDAVSQGNHAWLFGDKDDKGKGKDRAW